MTTKDVNNNDSEQQVKGRKAALRNTRRTQSLRVKTGRTKKKRTPELHRRANSDGPRKRTDETDFVVATRKNSMKTRNRFKVKKKLGPRDILPVGHKTDWKPAVYDNVSIGSKGDWLEERVGPKRRSTIHCGDMKHVKRKLGPRDVGRSNYNPPRFEHHRNISTTDFLKERLTYSGRRGSAPTRSKKTRDRFQVAKKLGPRDVDKKVGNWKPPKYDIKESDDDFLKPRTLPKRTKSFQLPRKKNNSQRRKASATPRGRSCDVDPRRIFSVQNSRSDGNLLKGDPLSRVTSESFFVVKTVPDSSSSSLSSPPTTEKPSHNSKNHQGQSKKRKAYRSPEHRRRRTLRRLSRADKSTYAASHNQRDLTADFKFDAASKEYLRKESEDVAEANRVAEHKKEEEGRRDPTAIRPSAPATRHERNRSEPEKRGRNRSSSPQDSRRHSFSHMIVNGSDDFSRSSQSPESEGGPSRRRYSFSDMVDQENDDKNGSPRVGMKLSLTGDDSEEISQLTSTSEGAFGEVRVPTPKTPIDSYTLFDQLDDIYDKKAKKVSDPEQLFDRLNQNADSATIELYSNPDRAPGAPSPRPNTPIIVVTSPGKPPRGTPKPASIFPDKKEGTIKKSFRFPINTDDDLNQHAIVANVILSFLKIDLEGNKRKNIHLILYTFLLDVNQTIESARSSSTRWESDSGTSNLNEAPVDPKLEFAKFLQSADDLSDDSWKTLVSEKVKELGLLEDFVVKGVLINHNFDVVDGIFNVVPNRDSFKDELCEVFGSAFKKALLVGDVGFSSLESEGFPVTVTDSDSSDYEGEASVSASFYNCEAVIEEPIEVVEEVEKPRQLLEPDAASRNLLRMSSEGQTQGGVPKLGMSYSYADDDCSGGDSTPNTPREPYADAWENAGEVTTPRDNPPDAISDCEEDHLEFYHPMNINNNNQKDQFCPGTPNNRFQQTPSPRSSNSNPIETPPHSPKLATPPGTPDLASFKENAKEGEDVFEIVNRPRRGSSITSDSSYSFQEPIINIPPKVRNWSTKKLVKWIRTWDKKCYNGKKLAKILSKQGVKGTILPLSAHQLTYLAKLAKVNMTQVEIDQCIFWLHTFIVDQFGPQDSPRE